MIKRFTDVTMSFFLLVIFSPIILIMAVCASVDTHSTGIFLQYRIGQYGKGFNIYKFRTFHSKSNKVSKFGLLLRKTKLDELPQLVNILKGEMSFVGPRPDIPGYYDTLEGEDRNILQLKPGLTSEASLKYYYEDDILKIADNPLQYNDSVIFPDKVRLNLQYYYTQNFFLDFKIIFKTILFFINKKF